MKKRYRITVSKEFSAIDDVDARRITETFGRIGIYGEILKLHEIHRDRPPRKIPLHAKVKT